MNTLTFKYNGQTYVFDRKNLKELLLELANYAHTKINELAPDTKEKLQHIHDVATMIYNNKRLYSMLLGDVKETFTRIKVSSPGTVGAYFLNCFSTNKYSGGMGCNAVCAISLRPYKYEGCEEGIYYLRDGKLEAINDRRTNHVYVYADSEPYWPQETLELMQANGVEKVTLTVEKPGEESVVYPDIAVEQLPSPRAEAKEKLQERRKKTSSPLYIVALLLLLLALITLSVEYVV